MQPVNSQFTMQNITNSLTPWHCPCRQGVHYIKSIVHSKYINGLTMVFHHYVLHRVFAALGEMFSEHNV